MLHLINYTKFISEGAPSVVYDGSPGNELFNIKYLALDDLANKRASRSNEKPENDALDNYTVGDIIRGKGIEDGEYYEGVILNIEKDIEGENISVKITVDGEIVELMPLTISFIENGDKGNGKSGPVEFDTNPLTLDNSTLQDH